MEQTRARGPDGRFPHGNGAGHGGPANGDGWGGPANGAGQQFTSETRPAGAEEGRRAAETAAEAARPHAVKMVDVWRAIAEDEKQPAMARIVAAEKIVNRAEGMPKQPVEQRTTLTVEDGRPPIDDYLREFGDADS